ncbi:MAG: WecB/TagA/CpsF family glycosyltransferase, partial [Propionibacteriales bacterium]|nr:WecB/TagA/CpsF family glycosyltransferase [Propionibacteriales bacterium]
MTENQVVQQVVCGLARDVGGWIVTPNTDILRICATDPAAAELVRQATCVVADGMPVLWASRIAGTPLLERVTGASLIFSISKALSAQAGSVYLIGGEPGVPEQAGDTLRTEFRGLRVLGADSPPVGFEHDPLAVSDIVERVKAADPDVVFVGL